MSNYFIGKFFVNFFLLKKSIISQLERVCFPFRNNRCISFQMKKFGENPTPNGSNLKMISYLSLVLSMCSCYSWKSRAVFTRSRVIWFMSLYIRTVGNRTVVDAFTCFAGLTCHANGCCLLRCQKYWIMLFC